ncbi:MAG: hypothetical protein ABI379_08925 [Rhodanobacter sp.]
MPGVASWCMPDIPSIAFAGIADFLTGCGFVACGVAGFAVLVDAAGMDMPAMLP